MKKRKTKKEKYKITETVLFRFVTESNDEQNRILMFCVILWRHL